MKLEKSWKHITWCWLNQQKSENGMNCKYQLKHQTLGNLIRMQSGAAILEGNSAVFHQANTDVSFNPWTLGLFFLPENISIKHLGEHICYTLGSLHGNGILQQSVGWVHEIPRCLLKLWLEGHRSIDMQNMEWKRAIKRMRSTRQ